MTKKLMCLLIIVGGIIVFLIVKISHSITITSTETNFQTNIFNEVGKLNKKSIADEKTNIFDRTNNDVKIENVITKKYSQREVAQFIRYYTTIEEVNKHFPIECLRKVGDKYYTVHLLKEGGVFYALYIYDKELKTYKVEDFWLYNTPIYKKQYDKLVINKSTFKDVHKIDKDSVIFYASKGTFSFHKTLDGYDVTIVYKGDEQHLIVSEVQVKKLEEYSIFTYLLPIDTPPNFSK